MSPRKIITLSEPILKPRCLLGEGPLWDAQTDTLHFIDILEKRVFHWQPSSKTYTMDQLDQSIGCLALCQSGGLACATASGFAMIQPGSNGRPALHHFCKPLEGDPERARVQRFNDGACDAKGRFFAGTLESADPPYNGQLWCYDPLLDEAKLVDDDIRESNGLGWSADNKTLFHTDSFKRAIFAYDYDLETGSVSNKRLHIDTSFIARERYALPDGLCLDSEGGIWSASWAGSRVTRFAPDGSEDIVISIPSAWNVTACCFGGPNLDQLYITTGSPFALGGDPRANLDPPVLMAQFPNSGNIFVADLAGEFREGVSRYPFAR
ncbi:hypothetical protein DL93DRAFT_2108007 [Clavulina sp. PMI_390]|nr:hypothetical protein DL93DRAFT_2108007 [Clavulina sp. PMI_390]